MGCGRSLFQAAEDGLLPRLFEHKNKHDVPDYAMGFNVVCSRSLVLFGSPVRIYIFSNVGYLLSCTLASAATSSTGTCARTWSARSGCPRSPSGSRSPSS